MAQSPSSRRTNLLQPLPFSRPMVTPFPSTQAVVTPPSNTAVAQASGRTSVSPHKQGRPRVVGPLSHNTTAAAQRRQLAKAAIDFHWRSLGVSQASPSRPLPPLSPQTPPPSTSSPRLRDDWREGDPEPDPHRFHSLTPPPPPRQTSSPVVGHAVSTTSHNTSATSFSDLSMSLAKGTLTPEEARVLRTLRVVAALEHWGLRDGGAAYASSVSPLPHGDEDLSSTSSSSDDERDDDASSLVSSFAASEEEADAPGDDVNIRHRQALRATRLKFRRLHQLLRLRYKHVKTHFDDEDQGGGSRAEMGVCAYGAPSPGLSSRRLAKLSRRTSHVEDGDDAVADDSRFIVDGASLPEYDADFSDVVFGAALKKCERTLKALGAVPKRAKARTDASRRPDRSTSLLFAPFRSSRALKNRDEARQRVTRLTSLDSSSADGSDSSSSLPTTPNRRTGGAFASFAMSTSISLPAAHASSPTKKKNSASLDIPEMEYSVAEQRIISQLLRRESMKLLERSKRRNTEITRKTANTSTEKSVKLLFPKALQRGPRRQRSVKFGEDDAIDSPVLTSDGKRKGSNFFAAFESALYERVSFVGGKRDSVAKSDASSGDLLPTPSNDAPPSDDDDDGAGGGPAAQRSRAVSRVLAASLAGLSTTSETRPHVKRRQAGPVLLNPVVLGAEDDSDEEQAKEPFEEGRHVEAGRGRYMPWEAEPWPSGELFFAATASSSILGATASTTAVLQVASTSKSATSFATSTQFTTSAIAPQLSQRQSHENSQSRRSPLPTSHTVAPKRVLHTDDVLENKLSADSRAAALAALSAKQPKDKKLNEAMSMSTSAEIPMIPPPAGPTSLVVNASAPKEAVQHAPSALQRAPAEKKRPSRVVQVDEAATEPVSEGDKPLNKSTSRLDESRLGESTRRKSTAAVAKEARGAVASPTSPNVAQPSAKSKTFGDGAADAVKRNASGSVKRVRNVPLTESFAPPPKPEGDQFSGIIASDIWKRVYLARGSPMLPALQGAPPVLPMASRPRAVVAAIGGCFDERILPCPMAERDAEAVATMLEMFGYVVNRLFGRGVAVTKDTLHHAVKVAVVDCGTDEAATCLVYIAGRGTEGTLHGLDGGDRHYILHNETKLSTVSRHNVIVIEDLLQIKTANVTPVVYADIHPIVYPLKGVPPANVGCGFAVTRAASTSLHMQFRYPAKAAGVFTWYFLKGLQGDAVRSGRVTPGLINAYIYTALYTQLRPKNAGELEGALLSHAGRGGVEQELVSKSNQMFKYRCQLVDRKLQTCRTKCRISMEITVGVAYLENIPAFQKKFMEHVHTLLYPAGKWYSAHKCHLESFTRSGQFWLHLDPQVVSNKLGTVVREGSWDEDVQQITGAVFSLELAHRQEDARRRARIDALEKADAAASSSSPALTGAPSAKFADAVAAVVARQRLAAKMAWRANYSPSVAAFLFAPKYRLVHGMSLLLVNTTYPAKLDAEGETFEVFEDDQLHASMATIAIATELGRRKALVKGSSASPPSQSVTPMPPDEVEPTASFESQKASKEKRSGVNWLDVLFGAYQSTSHSKLDVNSGKLTERADATATEATVALYAPPVPFTPETKEVTGRFNVHPAVVPAVIYDEYYVANKQRVGGVPIFAAQEKIFVTLSGCERDFLQLMKRGRMGAFATKTLFGCTVLRVEFVAGEPKVHDCIAKLQAVVRGRYQRKILKPRLRLLRGVVKDKMIMYDESVLALNKMKYQELADGQQMLAYRESTIRTGQALAEHQDWYEIVEYRLRILAVTEEKEIRVRSVMWPELFARVELTQAFNRSLLYSRCVTYSRTTAGLALTMASEMDKRRRLYSIEESDRQKLKTTFLAKRR